MPANTSMPTALRFRARPWCGGGWRAVEAQYKNATIALTHGNVGDQALLEDILEESKPYLPVDVAGLHFLLATPFRYRPLPPVGSRFRRREDPGAFYGAEDVKTACAEAGYWRFRFWMDSAALRALPESFPMTLFEFHGSTTAMIDLTKKPFASDRKKWIHPTDYTATQQLALEARSDGIEVIRSESVRNSPDGRCLTILSANVFKGVAEPYRHQQQSWNLFIQPPHLAVWQRSLDGETFEFHY